MDKKDLQKRYVQLYLVREQLKAMAEEKSAIEAKLNEFLVSVEAISKLEGVKAGEEIWSPLGSGIFVKSGIKDTENVLVSIGAGIVVKRPGKDALEILKTRLEELVNIDTQLTAEMERLRHQGDIMEKQLEELGLTKNETKVYLVLLELGLTTTSAIIKRAGINTSKVYESLERLLKKGLVSYALIKRSKEKDRRKRIRSRCHSAYPKTKEKSFSKRYSI